MKIKGNSFIKKTSIFFVFFVILSISIVYFSINSRSESVGAAANTNINLSSYYNGLYPTGVNNACKGNGDCTKSNRLGIRQTDHHWSITSMKGPEKGTMIFSGKPSVTVNTNIRQYVQSSDKFINVGSYSTGTHKLTTVVKTDDKNPNTTNRGYVGWMLAGGSASPPCNTGGATNPTLPGVTTSNPDITNYAGNVHYINYPNNTTCFIPIHVYTYNNSTDTSNWVFLNQSGLHCNGTIPGKGTCYDPNLEFIEKSTEAMLTNRFNDHAYLDEFTFSTKFNVTDLAKLKAYGAAMYYRRVGADNYITNVYLNGTSICSTTASNRGVCNSLTKKISDYLVSGGNTLSFTIKSSYSSAMFNVPEIKLTSTQNANLWTSSGNTHVSTNGYKNGSNWNDGQNNNTIQVNIGTGKKAYWSGYIKTNVASHDYRKETIKYTSKSEWDNVQLKTGSLLGSTVQGSGAGTYYRNLHEYIPQADDVGKTLCVNLAWSPISNSNPGSSTQKSCIKVPYNYPGCEGSDCKDGTGGDCALDGTCSNQCTIDDDCAPGSVISRGVKPVTTTSYSIAQPGDQVSFEYKLTNSGPTKTLDLTYRANVFIIPGAAASYNPDSATRAYGLWPSGWTRTGGVPVSLEREVLVGNGVINVETRDVGNSGILTLSAAGGYNISPGDMICSYLSVNKWSVVNDKVTGTIAASNVKCIQISKTPSLNIRGSDSMSGAKNWGSVVINKNGGFIGSSSSANNPLSVNQGSYSQYGLFANQSGTGSAPITNFGSAGWTANANFATIKNGNKTCALWAANTSGSGNSSNCLSNGQWQGGSFGNTSRTIRIPEISANSKISSQSTLDLNTLSGVDESIRFTTKNLDINGGKIKNRTTKVLYVEGNVNIVKDISMYHSFTNYSNIREIPSLIIYATGNITISSEVTIVDAVLIAGGHLNTCAQGTNGAPSLSGSGACSKQLIINGAVISKDAPRWYRTYGNENDGSFAPAEIINYTPNVFLLPFARTEDSNASGGWQTINSASMPTRY